MTEVSQPRIPVLLPHGLLAAHHKKHTALRPVAALMRMSTNDLWIQLAKNEGE